MKEREENAWWGEGGQREGIGGRWRERD